MTDKIDRLDTFSRLKAAIGDQTGLVDRLRTKHVRFTSDRGIYLHRGLSGRNAAVRQAKREAAGEQIWKAIAFEHSAETANRVFDQVLGNNKAKQAVTLKQLNKIAAALKNLRTEATAAGRPVSALTKTQQIQRLTLQAKTAIRDSDKRLYSVVVSNIRKAPSDVRAAVTKELAGYERAIGLTMRRVMEANLQNKSLALVSERDSIVRTRTVNLLKMLDPEYRSVTLSRRDDANHDANNTMGAIRNEFNRQNVHANVRDKTMAQGMASSGAPEFIASRRGCFAAQSDMVKTLSTQKWQPELLVQTFFMPWQDTRGSRISYAGSAPPVSTQNEGLALLRDLSIVARERAKEGLLPLKVKILINDPKTMADDRSPNKMSLKTLRKELARIDPKGAQVEVWGAVAHWRDSHHKKMTVAIGDKESPGDAFGVLVMTGNHDTQKMLDSGMKLSGRDVALKQRKQFYSETLRSGRLLAVNAPNGSRKAIEKAGRDKMRQTLNSDPPGNDRNAGNTLMTHQPPNPTLTNQFRLSEPYNLIKSGIRSAKSKIRIVMPYFQLLDLNDEIKGAIARGVDVDIVLGYDQGAQEMLGQSNRASAEDLTEFRRELAGFHGERDVGKLKIGWFQPPRIVPQNPGNDAAKFNPSAADYPHQKYVSIDGEVSIIGSFNTDYQSMHSAEQMLMVPSDDKANRFLDYMSVNTIPHDRLPRNRGQPLSLPQKMVRSYVGPPSYTRLGLNSKASERLPVNREKYDDLRFESIDETQDQLE
ncbi:MAG: hypothetical protein GY701_24755 [Sulfitobacter sp.]|nr:hypothetical protein [Sulfitobacter sp.]